MWERSVRLREEWTIDMVYNLAKRKGICPTNVILDIAKSFQRNAWRSDGKVPTLLAIVNRQVKLRFSQDFPLTHLIFAGVCVCGGAMLQAHNELPPLLLRIWAGTHR